MTGRLLAGTSGFAYRGWVPRFYPAGLRPLDFLRHYGQHFPACELNNTFYRQPSPDMVAAWLAATPPGFRFAVKAQRGGSQRALMGDPTASVPWLTGPLRGFGDRLGAILFRIPEPVPVDLGRLEALLAAWPRDLPLVVEPRHPSWASDAVTARLAEARAVLCATELPEDPDPPLMTVTGSFLYLRLRRHDYPAGAIEAWADRVVPFLESGLDAFAFFRHDESGRATELARMLELAVRARLSGASRASA